MTTFRTAAVLAGIFVLALFAHSLTDFTRRVEGFQSRLEDSDRRLADAQAEVGRLRADRDGLAAERLNRIIASGGDHDLDALYRDILAPSVQINGNGGVGGGTILYSRKAHTYVITAYHVIQKAVAKDGGDAAADVPIEVLVYDARGDVEDTLRGDLVAHDEKRDLALLRLRTEKSYGSVARLAPRETLRKIKVFTPVYAVGCPLGHDPLPTLGEVATLHKEVGGEKLWMMNAPTIFGNSGGGIFHRETREMIGVSVMICTYDGVVSTPVPHLGIMVSLETVYDWLDSMHYHFITQPDLEPGACEHAQAAQSPQR